MTEQTEPTHWAITGGSGYALAWFSDYAKAKREFDAMQGRGGEYLSLIGIRQSAGLLPVRDTSRA